LPRRLTKHSLISDQETIHVKVVPGEKANKKPKNHKPTTN